MTQSLPDNVPNRISKRLEQLKSEVARLLDEAATRLKTELAFPVAFRFDSSAPTPDVLTEWQRAQSVSFITRYEHLPKKYGGRIVQRGDDFCIGNLAFFRHALNDFRPFIQNKKDAVHYQKVHNTWYPMLGRQSPSEGLTIRALSDDDADVTPTFMKWLGERNRAITFVIEALEYGYLYNGILQHSDVSYSQRFWGDYTSGELNWVLWKHVHVLGFIREMLLPYYRLANTLTFPKLGPL